MQFSTLPRRISTVHAGRLPHAVQPFSGFSGVKRKAPRHPGLRRPRTSAASEESEALSPVVASAAAAAAAAEAPAAAAGAAEAYQAALEAAGGDDSRAFAVAMAREAWDTKAEDTLVLHVAPLVYWTQYMVIATVFSKPQLNALLAKMTKQAKEVFGRELSHSVEGRSAWELLDYGDVVVHIMTAEQREYYDLESFYGTAEEVELPFLKEGAGQGLGWQKRLA